ncbi:MAG: MurT ligase domain-containing protein [Candidatus Dormibacteria bacterium]
MSDELHVPLNHLPLRTKLARQGTRLVNSVSRTLGRGEGTVIGGHVGLLIDPNAPRHLSEGRTVVLVSGTNGKTTTTRLVAQALSHAGPVVATTGANLLTGIMATLANANDAASVVLEVDEAYLDKAIHLVHPRIVVLLNLSRDQLDRFNEVRMLAKRWHDTLHLTPDIEVVANADDPMVVWVARDHPKVSWVGAGVLWHQDAVGCPECNGHIVFEGTGWHCGSCSLSRPEASSWVEGDVYYTTSSRLPVHLELPGRCNVGNAALAAVAAKIIGIPAPTALRSMAEVHDVLDRYARLQLAGVQTTLYLAKNPGGWAELIDMLKGKEDPLVMGINARIADGKDTSWLWDVPFEEFAPRHVVVTGERRWDIALRLEHAGVSVAVAHSMEHAIRAAAAVGSGSHVDVIGNYTAFQDLRHDIRHKIITELPRHAYDALEVPCTSPAGRVAPGHIHHRGSGEALHIVVLYPDLLGTYGDTGNGQILANRAAWRGLPVLLTHVRADDEVPTDADCYCLGGGEDAPQTLATTLLQGTTVTAGPLHRAYMRGAFILAICAGFQILGTSYPGAGGVIHEGTGLIDVATRKGEGERAVGELRSIPSLALVSAFHEYIIDGAQQVAFLTGFENHAGRTVLGEGVPPLGRVEAGIGNGDGSGGEGALLPRLIGTYMHGTACARNPALADLILGVVTGAPLAPLPDDAARALRAERFAAVKKLP